MIDGAGTSIIEMPRTLACSDTSVYLNYRYSYKCEEPENLVGACHKDENCIIKKYNNITVNMPKDAMGGAAQVMRLINMQARSPAVTASGISQSRCPLTGHFPMKELVLSYVNMAPGTKQQML